MKITSINNDLIGLMVNKIFWRQRKVKFFYKDYKMKKVSSSLWDSEIDKITNQFEKTFGHLSIQQINWKPNATTWSIAQNIDHLINTNKSYFSIIEQANKGTYKKPYSGKFRILVNFFGKAILKSVNPNRKKRIRTFKIWEPSKKETFQDIMCEFKKHQIELKKLMNNASDLIANDFVISSPVNRHIVYKLKTAFEIIISHEKRHFEQAKEVLNDENFMN